MKKKVAFTVWNERIAPLFDVAKSFLVVEYYGKEIIDEYVKYVESIDFFERIKDVLSLHIDTLVCGGISRQYFEVLTSNGISIIPFIAGDIQRVKQAYFIGNLNEQPFIMPGCVRSRHRILRRWNMPGQGSGRGQGGGRGMGGGRRGMGGGRMRGTVDGMCICPKCGYKEEHYRGQPCFERLCPNCKIPLRRE